MLIKLVALSLLFCFLLPTYADHGECKFQIVDAYVDNYLNHTTAAYVNPEGACDEIVEVAKQRIPNGFNYIEHRIQRPLCRMFFATPLYPEDIRSDNFYFDLWHTCKDLPILPPEDDGKTYSIEVSSESGKLVMIPPKGKLNLVAIVKDNTGNMAPDIKVELTVEVEANSGGHEHDNSVRHTNHSGKLSGTSTGPNKVEGTTDSTGYNFTFTSPIVSGVHKITAACIDIDCGDATLDNIKAGVDNLTSLGVGNWELIGDVKNSHTDNHYLTDTSINRIKTISKLYKDTYPLEKVLHLNDASLITGGLFDIGNNWKPSHHEHRRGTVIDIRANNNTGAIPPRNWNAFKVIVRDSSGTASLERFYNSDIFGDEIISKRHFHVRLEGRSE